MTHTSSRAVPTAVALLEAAIRTRTGCQPSFLVRRAQTARTV